MKKKNTQNIRIDVQVSNLEYFQDDLQNLPPNQTFQLTIDYPVSKPAIYKIRTGKSGMGLAKLLKEIGKSYDKVYAASDKYGVWGHCMGDLAIEGISVDFKKKKITLSVGS